MINKAIAHITEQAMKANNNFATFIEEHLTEICTTEGIAKKILDENKSLNEFCKSCRDKAEKEARKNGTGIQIAGLPDAEYYRMAEEYYGITENIKQGTYEEEHTVVNINDFL